MPPLHSAGTVPVAAWCMQFSAQPTHLCLLAEGGAAAALSDGPGSEEGACFITTPSLGQGWWPRGVKGKFPSHYHYLPPTA